MIKVLGGKAKLDHIKFNFNIVKNYIIDHLSINTSNSIDLYIVFYDVGFIKSAVCINILYS